MKWGFKECKCKQIFIDISMHFAIMTTNKTRQGYVSLDFLWEYPQTGGLFFCSVL
jgi:hypothetical protein